MADKESVLPAIDLLMCHTGASFTDACYELGITPEDLVGSEETELPKIDEE